MKVVLTRTITGIVYLFFLGFALFVSDWILATVFTLFLWLALYEYFNLSKRILANNNCSYPFFLKWILPVIWIIIPVVLLIYWCIALNANSVMVAVLTLICMNDTMAYVFGSLFGKHKMWTTISPKKSWEGFFGGFFCSLALIWAFSDIPYFQNNHFTNLLQWLGFAFVIVITGTLGDFAESYLKRLANLKDSGDIIPGHGGVLDRIDSMLFAVPAGFIYWTIIGIW